MNNILRKTLKKYWNYDTFRNGQEEIISSVLSGNDTMVVMPTGGGKSLCYQLPAIISDGIALVISPLIALMKDQVDSLTAMKIPATLINSSIPYDEINLRMQDAINGRYKLIYIAPERLESDRFIKLIKKLSVSFVAVDEAHCISEWGHDFRPSYLNIAEKLKKSGNFKFVALTATATPEVREDIVKQLGFVDYNSYVRGFDRPNLSYITENISEKEERLTEIINDTPEGSTIVYAGSRKRAEKYTKVLRDNHINAEVYHGGMQPLLRKKIQERFIDGETKVIVATNAFGMGIDKADVRNVIHTDLTSTLEAYYQEAGRAGRDGMPANCYLLHQPSDINLQDYFLRTTHPEKDDIEEVYEYFLYLKSDNIPLDIEEISIETRIPKMAVVNIVKLLDKYDVLRINKASARGMLRFASEMNRIREYYLNTTSDRKIILEALMKNISRKAFDYEIPVDMNGILRVSKIKDKNFHKEIKSLIYDDIIKFKPAGSGTTVSVLFRENLEKSKIDFEALDYRRKHANQKLERVIQYAETYDCKRNFILNYFSEDDVNGECGRCSSCKSPKRNPKIDERNKFLMINILSAANILNGKFSKSAIFDLLKGKMTKQIFAFKLQNSDLFGSCRKINEKMLKNEINTAVRYRFIEIETSQFKPVSITDSGLEYLKKQNVQISQKTSNTENDKKLYRNLQDIRQKLSEKNNIQPRGVISDKVLKQISDNKPLNENELKQISGVTQYFAEKYSPEFLCEININELKTKLSKLDKEILNKIHKKIPLDVIRQNYNISFSDLSLKIQDFLENGANPDLDFLYSKSSYEIIINTLKKNKNLALRKLRSELGMDEDYYLLRIMLAKARRMLDIK